MREFEITVLIVPPGEAARVETIPYQLDELQKRVEGLIEPFAVGIAGAIGLCNEEHLMIGLEENRFIEALGRPMLGTFLVVGDRNHLFGSLNEEQIAQAREMFDA